MRVMVALSMSTFLSLVVDQAAAGVCDYKPSVLLGGQGAAAVGGAAAGTATVGTAASLAGFYTLTHATSGLTMLGSTLAGPSAAGTIGIIGGTGGLLGTAGAIVMAPATIIAAGLTAVGIGAYEGACVFAVERIDDPVELMSIVTALAEQADPEFFRLTTLVDGNDGIIVRQEDDIAIYAIEDLYIADGVLKHEDWLRNTTIGAVSWVELIPTQD